MPRAIAFALVLLWAVPLWAASRVAIVKPRDARDQEAIVRLEAELRAGGFEVTVLTAQRGMEPREQVESVQLDPPPFAIIAITRTATGAAADVWVADRLSKKTVVRRLESADQASAMAIRAIELLRASLLEVEADPEAKLPEDVARWMREDDVQPQPQPQVQPQPQPVPLMPPAPLPRVLVPPPSLQRPPAFVAPATPERAVGYDSATVSVAPGLLVGALIDVAFVPTIRASVPLPRSFFVRATMLGTVIDNTLEAEAGTARVRQDLMLAEVGRGFGDADDLFVPLLSLGVGAYHLGARGHAEPPFDSLGGDVWSFAMTAGGGITLRLADPLALILEAHMVIVLPRANVRIGEETLGPHGLPLFLPTLGLLFSL